MKKVTDENLIKLFGMTGQLIVNDLDKICADKNIELGHAPNRLVDKDEVYYPQFQMSIRQEAAFMAEHYEVFYCLEKSIRKLIIDTMVAEDGATWWKVPRVPQRIYDDVADRIKREQDSGFSKRSDEPIDYTNFGELGEIIKSNWTLFGAIFDSPKAVEKVMWSLNMLRNNIAHCCPLAEDEIIRLKLSVRDWFRLME